MCFKYAGGKKKIRDTKIFGKTKKIVFIKKNKNLEREINVMNAAANAATRTAIKQLRNRIGCLEFLYPKWTQSKSKSQVRMSSNDFNNSDYGTRLADIVASDLVDINMSKYTVGKRQFDWCDNRIIPTELQPLNKEDRFDQFDESLIVGLVKLVIYHETHDEDLKKQLFGLVSRLYKRNKKSLEIIKEKLEKDLQNDKDIEESVFFKRLIQFGYSAKDIHQFVNCIRAKTTKEALLTMQDCKWPEFLIRFTMRRRCETKEEAFGLTRLFQSHFALLKKDSQIDCTFKLIRVLQQKNLVELLPGVCSLICDEAKREIKLPLVFNQLLWSLTSFGKTFTKEQFKYIADAQRIIAQEMIKKSILMDTKGYLAMAYALKDLAPEKSRVFINMVKTHEYEYSKEEKWALNDDNLHTHRFGTFVYRDGVYALELMLSQSEAEVFSVMARIPKEYRTAVLWACAIHQLNKLGFIDARNLNKLWNQVKTEVKLTPFLVSQFATSECSTRLRYRIIMEAAKSGVHINRSLSVKSFQLASKVTKQSKMNELFTKTEHTHLEYEALLHTYIRGNKQQKVWALYREMTGNGYEPTVSCLVALCKAATKPNIKWGNMYAPQQAVVEFKSWVRGANEDLSDVDDLIKVYPTPTLFHWYILMLGKAGYGDELLTIVPWMERIGFKPNNDCLCALIHFSPNGLYMLQHGQRIIADKETNEPPNSVSNWPWPSRSAVKRYTWNLRHLILDENIQSLRAL